MEPFYPLHAYVCGKCFLVQLEAYVSADHIFSDYAYFSSYSDSWVEHARVYCERMTKRFLLSYGAIQSLEKLLTLVHENGFILINDYGQTQISRDDEFEHQRFSLATPLCQTRCVEIVSLGNVERSTRSTRCPLRAA